MDEAITKKIDQLSFGIVSPALIKKIATVNVISPELYDADGYPVERGLMDLRMGVIDPGLRCKVCGGRMRTCHGHFGYIQLSRPVLHILYINQIHEVLRSFCGFCGRILMPQDKIDSWKVLLRKAKQENDVESLRALLRTISGQLKRTRKCPYCKAKAPAIKLEKPSTFYDGDVRLWPTTIRERLERVSDNDVEVLGFEPGIVRPEWMVLTTLLVPPITMRPSITLMSGERSEDDLTHKLSDIVRVNQRLLENINAGAPEIIIEDLWDLLQYHLTTYFDNSVSQVPPARHKTNRPLKTLAQRLKGKEGRFRCNLAGKRVNFCARSVISPDPFISIDELGVPMKVATELTIPETVTEWNAKWLKAFIKNGDTYPGANYVITDEGKRKKITEETKEQILEELSPGWVVERHLLNGDIVLFNRQPSLHRMSMMGHKIRILPGKTFRVHPAVCIPYNADFDGDEMNLHLPQTPEARSEAENLLLLENQIITPRYGLSIIGEEEDTLMGIYFLTQGNTYLTRREACDYLIASGIDKPLPTPEKKEKGKELWNGRQIFSLALPPDLNFEKLDIKIQNGILIDGVITKKLIGPEGGELIHYIYSQYGPEFTKNVMNGLNYLGLAVARKNPYSTSFTDLDLSRKTKIKIKEMIKEGTDEVKQILKDYKANKIKPLPGKTMKETAEAMILFALNRIRNKVGKLIDSSVKGKETNLIKMSRCGLAKLLQLGQMSGFAGQQALRGKRIELGYTGRTLSMFKQGDRGAKSRGFISRSYADGLDPVGMFFNAMVGRDSLMDTAMRTPKSGYMQRRLINALQDLRVNYDGTVRDSGQRIIQFKFGGDNVDVSKSDHGGVDINV